MNKRKIAALLGIMLLCGCTKLEAELSSAVNTNESTQTVSATALKEQSTEVTEPLLTSKPTEEPKMTEQSAQPGEEPQETEQSEQSGEEPQKIEQSAQPNVEPQESVQQEQTQKNETEFVQDAPVENKIDDLDLLLKQTAESCGVTGLSVALFDQSGIVHTYNMGYADKENGVLCDDNTVYRVASVSKLVAAMSLMTLYDKGLLSPKSELVELTGLPYNQAGQTPVKVWHLLTHTAGIFDTSTYNSAVEFKYAETGGYYTPIEKLLPISVNGNVGKYYSYSNFGYGTVGAVIERVSGEYFCEYTYENLFEPMGLNAGYAIDQITDRSKIANVYAGGRLSYEPKNSFRDCKYYRGYELGESYFTANSELLISCPDLAKLGMMIAGNGSSNGVRILSTEAVDLINSEWFRTGGDFNMGLSVRIYDGNIVEGRKIFGHPGQALGNVCGLYYDPADGTGIAICTSGSSPVTEDNGVYTILDGCIKAAYNCLFDRHEQ